MKIPLHFICNLLVATIDGSFYYFHTKIMLRSQCSVFYSYLGKFRVFPLGGFIQPDWIVAIFLRDDWKMNNLKERYRDKICIVLNGRFCY